MQRIIHVIEKLEDWLLVSMVGVMVILAVAQIIYRNFFDAGLSWADPMLRVLVLWVALAGAVVATRTDNHIRIDFFTRYFSPGFNALVQRMVYLICTVVCVLIAWHSARFVMMEYEFGSIAFGGIPTWATASIIPVGFTLMALRYTALFIYPPSPDPDR